MSARPHASDTLLTRLAAWGDRVRTDAAALEAASSDASSAVPGNAAAVVFPQSTAEVSLLAREAAALGVGLVPRGSGTGKAGGCVPCGGEVVVDVSRMNAILQLQPADLYAVVQPGLVTAQLDRAAGEVGLMYPPDPASWESCSLGGNIATNAGGPRAVKYGVTARYVWGLEVVLAGGEVLNLGRRSIKGVAGLDLTALMVGSEGTLGLVTQATLHLVPSPRGVQTGWLSFATPEAASRGAARVFSAGMLPRMLELLDPMALAAARPLARWDMPPGDTALLVETDGASDELAYQDLLALCEVAGADHAAVARSEKEREGMRRSRREVSTALKATYPCKVSDDIAVPRSRMHELLAMAQAYSQDAGLLGCAYGHLGDGNLHVNVLCKTPQERARSQAVRERLWRFAVSVGGTISGEHGIGLTKREALPTEHPPALIDAQRRIKAALDPAGIMNPGKVFLPAP